MSAPKPVVDFVERFERDRKVFLSADYKEEQLRAEFLNPFFESLGWDVANKAGLTEVFKPVIREESTKVAGAVSQAGVHDRGRPVKPGTAEGFSTTPKLVVEHQPTLGQFCFCRD